eukprot:scaffold3269_cov108-Isochrysis_galbana.AAC.1
MEGGMCVCEGRSSPRDGQPPGEPRAAGCWRHLLLASNLVGHRHGQPHAGLPADARRRNHVVPIRVGRVAHQLAVDLGAPGLGMLQLLQHNHAAAARDDETVARHVEGARGRLGAVIVPGG